MSEIVKINLLYVITKLELGGAQKYLLHQIQGIDKNKFAPFLFTARDGLLVVDAERISGLHLYRSHFLDRRLNVLKDLLAFIEIFLYIKKNNIKIVHTHSSKAGILGRLAAKAAGVKVIIHNVHGWSFHDHQPKVFFYLCVFLERLCARLTGTLIVVSNYDQQIGEVHSIYSQNGYVVIRFGIDYAKFKNASSRNLVRRNMGLPEDDFVVGMVACFKPQKAPLDFVRLAIAIRKILPQCKFVLVGDGVLHKEIVRVIAEAGLGKVIILTGWRRDIPDILSALDVFVLTSLWEGLPIAVMEAMAVGVPVVATDTGGIREIITSGGTGYLVNSADMADMCDKVLQLYKDPGLRKSLAGRAAELIGAEGFSLESMIQRTEKIYDFYQKCLHG